MKRLLLGAWLIAFGLWPLVQYGIVSAYGLDPSRYAGWATLAAPVFEPNVVLFRIELHGARTLDDVQAAKIQGHQWSDDLRAEYRRYITALSDSGRLALPPEQLGKRLLEEHGETGMVLIVVQTRKIDRATSRIQTQVERYSYSDRAKALEELQGGTTP
jgi:hypothetical protein